LHVLGTPPAFILSQDQTLHRNCQENLFPCTWTSNYGSLLLGKLGLLTIYFWIVTLPTTLRLSTCSALCRLRFGVSHPRTARKDILPGLLGPCQGLFQTPPRFLAASWSRFRPPAILHISHSSHTPLLLSQISPGCSSHHTLTQSLSVLRPVSRPPHAPSVFPQFGVPEPPRAE
jgi:hypothetical protein